MQALADRRPATTSAEIHEYREAIKAGRTGPYGWVSLVGLRTQDPLEISQRVAKGLSFAAFERFQRNSGLSLRDLAEAVVIAPSTLHRRRQERRLEPQESDRLLRLSRVFGRALELCEGEVDAARQWLGAPQRALAGQRPLVLAMTDVGAREVEALVDRLEQGVLT